MWTLKYRIVTFALWASALTILASMADAGTIRNDGAKDVTVTVSSLEINVPTKTTRSLQNNTVVPITPLPVVTVDDILSLSVGFVPVGKPSHGKVTVLTIVDGIPARVPLGGRGGWDGEGEYPESALDAFQYCPRLCIHDLKGVMCGERSADFDSTCTKDPTLRLDSDSEPWNKMNRNPHPNELTGDINMDNAVNLEDLMFIFNYVFRNGSEPWPHRLVADVDCNFECNEADIALLAQYLFSNDFRPTGILGRR